MLVARGTVLAALGAALLAFAGCGGSGGSDSTAETGMPPKVPSVKQFPKVRGRTMTELIQGLPTGPQLAPSVSLLTPGVNRFGFGLFDSQNKQITEAPGAIYIARTLNSRAMGPYVARWESMQVTPRYLSKTVSTDPDAAKTLYVATPRFRKPGKYVVAGLFRLDNRLVVAGTRVEVVKGSNVPVVGAKAPSMHTPTKASVGGDLAKIDTRDPHDSMHDVDYASALGKRPIVIVFATPALCQSRVCGPVVDIAEQVKHEMPKNDAAWIHQEIYKDNQVNKGYTPQFLTYHLPTEPWAFTIDRTGKIAARIEGAYSADELTKAVKAALK
jgi:hypothetical protein